LIFLGVEINPYCRSPQPILDDSHQAEEPHLNINDKAKEEQLHTEDPLEAITALHKRILTYFKNTHKTTSIYVTFCMANMPIFQKMPNGLGFGYLAYFILP
jgi:hypothetical protein